MKNQKQSDGARWPVVLVSCVVAVVAIIMLITHKTPEKPHQVAAPQETLPEEQPKVEPPVMAVAEEKVAAQEDGSVVVTDSGASFTTSPKSPQPKNFPKDPHGPLSAKTSTMSVQ